MADLNKKLQEAIRQNELWDDPFKIQAAASACEKIAEEHAIKEKIDLLNELIQWINKEILNNKYYDNSPRFKEGAAVCKIKSEELINSLQNN